jgi:surface antigen
MRRPGRDAPIGEDRRRKHFTRQRFAILGTGARMHIIRFGFAAIVAASLAACSATPETGQGAKENTGTLLGALAGGLIGSQFGGGTGERVAAGLAGAAIGGLIGNRIGAGMDDEDKQRAYAAQMQALEGGRSGTAVAWKNPDSGRYGSVVPGPAYQSNGQQCRQYTHTIYISGRPEVARGTACRNPDGTWTAVG